MPVLALRGLTIFPNMLLHFDVGRETSIRALDQAMNEGMPLFLVAQKDLSVSDPVMKDLYTIGTICNVKQILRLPGDTVRVMVEGHTRGRLLNLQKTAPYLLGEVETLEQGTRTRNSPKTEALIRSTYELFESYVEMSPRMNGDVLIQIMASDDPGYIADYIAQNIAMRVGEKQAILEELRPVRRLEKLSQALGREMAILELEHSIQGKVREHLADNQRDYYLREQLKVLQNELGEGDGDNEIREYRERIASAKLPQEVEEKLLKEVDRLAKQPYNSAESAVSRNYLDLCLELPWGKKTKERVSVAAARKILDAEHYGLKKVKERILEFLAVKQLAPELRGQVLCLVGPPGVGKTSVAMSVAKATGRKLARISLGGVHDEAEIRGHRKTYVGAMPGRIIEGIRRAGSCNPLLLLDEIDKLASDIHGDPASALLEVLDGEQNAAFRDNFLEMPFDLSDVLFITTANTLDTIPRPLLDRMEVIELTSYTDEEKLRIARDHLLPKELRRHGLKRGQLHITDDAIREIIQGYTRESGVRVLERQIAALCRKAAMAIVSGETKRFSVSAGGVASVLGPQKYHPEHRETEQQVGVVNGLAWTQVGGEMLQTEVNVVPGSGKIELTGNLGDVMKESVKAALSYIRSRAAQLGVEPNFYKNRDIHVHFPEGAVPKDGPSAGVTAATALVSALTGIPVKQDVAMTGEITLRGRVLPIGGLREKTMAALRNGMHTVIIPADNLSDLDEIDPNVRSALHFIPASQIDQVLANALVSTEAKPLSALEEIPEPHTEPQGTISLKQ